MFQLANRLRVHDPDFNAEDLLDSTNEPQWLQDLTNNYKKIHLNKFWHLLPESDQTKANEPSANLNIETKDDIVEQNLLITNIKQQQMTPVPEDNFQFVTTNNDAVSNNLNLGMNNLTINNDNNNQIDYSQPPQQLQQQQEASYNPAESQQSIPFYSSNKNGYLNQEPNYAATNDTTANQEIQTNSNG